MTLFGEFRFEMNAFPLEGTLLAIPEAAVEIERVVVSDESLTPYFWVATERLEAFETAAEADPSIERLRLVDSYDGEALYRAKWAESVEETIYAFTEPDILVLEASGNDTGWELRIRFDDREQLTAFQSFCNERDISFVVQRLYSETQPLTAGQYGLTDKQREALVTAWHAGYFESPRAVTLDDVAESLDITHQSLSQRLRRAHHELIANTLIVTPPAPSNETDST